MKIWDDQEVKDLFFEVEECKRKNKSLRSAFASHAKKYSRQPNSVRNYYYHEVDNLSNDNERAKRLNVEILTHQKSHYKNFEEGEAQRLAEEIENLKKEGFSVRAACQKLSGGDLTKMTRFQNKYQNFKRSKNGNVNDNIIVFRKIEKKILTENDINSLFLGLVKLIKKNAVDDYVEKNKLREKIN